MFRILLILSLALPSTALARKGKRGGMRAPTASKVRVRTRTSRVRTKTRRDHARPARVRTKTPVDRARPTRTDRARPTRTDRARPTRTDRARPTRTDRSRPNRTRTSTSVHVNTRSRTRRNRNRVIVGNTLRAPSRYRAPRRHRRHYRRPAPYVYYGARPRYRPVTIIVDHHFVYDRINRAERRMARLEGRVTRLDSWQAHRDLEQDTRDMRGELAAIDRSSDRIRSWHHWEATQNRLHRLRWRLDGVQADLAGGPQQIGNTAPIHTVPDGVNPMSETAFAKVEYEMQAASFRNDKLRVVRRIARNQWVTSAQARAMVRYVHHTDDKLEAEAILAPRVVDPQNM